MFSFSGASGRLVAESSEFVERVDPKSADLDQGSKRRNPVQVFRKNDAKGTDQVIENNPEGLSIILSYSWRIVLPLISKDGESD
jgi:hypothetical protein